MSLPHLTRHRRCGAQYIVPRRKAGSHALSQLTEFMPEPD
jgi:hypothetical protein